MEDIKVDLGSQPPFSYNLGVVGLVGKSFNCFTIEITCNLTLKLIRQHLQKGFQFMVFLFKVVLAIWLQKSMSNAFSTSLLDFGHYSKQCLWQRIWRSLVCGFLYALYFKSLACKKILYHFC